MDVSHNGFGESLGPLLQVLPLCASLTELDVSGNALGDAGAALLASTLTVSTLKDVTSGLSGTIAAIAANGIAHHAATKRRWQTQAQALCQLAVLRLGDNGVGPEGAQALGEALKYCRALKALLLPDNSVGYEGAKHIADALKSNSSLQARATPASLQPTPPRPHRRQSPQPTARFREISPTGLRPHSPRPSAATPSTHSQHPRSPSTTPPRDPWQELHLGNNHVGGSGARSLAFALRENRGLLMLRLPRNNLLDAACAPLAEALPHNGTLRLLDISGSKVGDTGAMALADALQDNTTLRTLKLHDNILAEHGGRLLLERLQAYMELDDIKGAAIGGLYSLTLQGNQVSLSTTNAIKAICEGRRKHDQVPHAVHDQIFDLQPVVPALELTSTQVRLPHRNPTPTSHPLSS